MSTDEELNDFNKNLETEVEQQNFVLDREIKIKEL